MKKRMTGSSVLRRMLLGVAVVGGLLNPTPYNILSVTIAHGASDPFLVGGLWLVWGAAALWFYRLIRRRLGLGLVFLLIGAVAVGVYFLNTLVGLFDVFSFGFWRWMAPLLGGVLTVIVLSGGRRGGGAADEDEPVLEPLEPPDYPRLTR